MSEKIHQITKHRHRDHLPRAASRKEGEVWRCECGKRFVALEDGHPTHPRLEWERIDPVFHPILFWKTMNK